ncbi:MAG: DNA-3-methyladenine glycosylase 2 family protein [Anaerolineae bacterium]|nr:DNA-3-methyladenine glycosylase 2 family protein [Anaerolineae bacterium]
MRIELAARQPFSLQQVIRSHGWPQLLPFHWERESDALLRVERLTTGTVVALNFHSMENGLAVEVSDEELTDAERAELETTLDWMFGLDMDFGPFYEMARGEPKLAGVEANARGRVLRSATFWEDTIKTILTTNTAWSGTIRMNAALVAQFGDPLPAAPAMQAFPTPAAVAASDPDTLRNITKLGYRAPYIHELADAVAAGRLDLERLKDPAMPTAEVRKRLLAIKGVGGYAAANLLMILGRYDFIPIDSWAMNQVSQEWYGGQPVGPKEVEAAFERWEEWKGLVYWWWDWDQSG